jgi:catechol-2,3-dioxygenase
MKSQSLFSEIGFVMYPVKDVAASRRFYEEILNLKVTANWEDKWIEYDIGPGTLAIVTADEDRQAGRHGPCAGLETYDLDALLAHLKEKNVPLKGEPFDTPVCRGCIIRDPDGNELLLHQRKSTKA